MMDYCFWDLLGPLFFLYNHETYIIAAECQRNEQRLSLLAKMTYSSGLPLSYRQRFKTEGGHTAQRMSKGHSPIS